MPRKGQKQLRNVPDEVWVEAHARPARELAERLGISVGAVYRRWGRLRKRGLITGAPPRGGRQEPALADLYPEYADASPWKRHLLIAHLRESGLWPSAP